MVVTRPNLPDNVAVLRSMPRPRHALPPAPGPLLGREQHLLTLRALLHRADGRLLTLTGAGGSGKTRLALQLAADTLDQFPDGVWFVPLATIADPTLVTDAIAQTLGGADAAGRSPSDGVSAFLRDRVALLVLDNFEQVLDAAEDVADLLAACPALRVMVTSRAPLHLREEQEFAVGPLALPAGRTGDVSVDVIRTSAAVQLFVERARRVRPDFELTAENAVAVADICRAVDGLPLAVELAAGRTKTLTPPALLSQLDTRLEILAGGPRDLPARQRTLRDTIRWSYDLLSPSEQALFRRLAVFVDGCTLAAAAVCDLGDGRVPDVLAGLDSLVDNSLLGRLQGSGGEPRFAMLETLREYGLEQLAASGEEAAVRRAHADYFTALAELDDLHGPSGSALARQLEADRANLRAAVRFSARAADGDGARDGGERLLRLAAALGYFWYLQGQVSEGRAWCAAALATPAAAANPALRARVRYSAGQLAWDGGDLPAARAVLEHSIADARAAMDGRGLARALYVLGEVLWDLGERDAARAVVEESAAHARAAGFAWELASALERLAVQAFQRGDWANARSRYEESIGLLRQLDDRPPLAYGIRCLGFVARAEGRYDEALRCMRESIAINGELRDLRGVAAGLAALAGLAVALGDPERAAQLSGAAAAMLDRAGAASLLPRDRLLHEQTLAAEREALDRDALAMAWAAGRSLSVEAALALAADAVERPDGSAAAGRGGSSAPRAAGAADTGTLLAATSPAVRRSPATGGLPGTAHLDGPPVREAAPDPTAPAVALPPPASDTTDDEGASPTPAAGFVGREAELRALTGLLAQVAAGRGGLALVTGEAGIGKTRLLTELAERAEAAGWLVLRGRAYEADGTPYLPFVEALDDYVRACPADLLHTQVGGHAPDLVRLFPELERRFPDLAPSTPPPEQARYRLFGGMVAFIDALARAAPRGMLLLLNDLHWADAASVQLLLHLGRRLAGTPALVVAACRPLEGSSVQPAAELFAALRREPLGERLDLAPLAPAAVAALVGGLSGRAPAAAVAAALHHQTNGNPFFVQELVRHLQAEGRDLGDPAVADEAWRVPAGVQEVLAARLARLSAAANRLLQAAAVLGDGMRFDVLGDAAGVEPLALLEAVDEVTAAGILREEQADYHFSHALVRQAVYDALSLPRRQQLHLRAAAAIERLYARDLTPHLPALAEHYQLAGPAATEQALRYARRAAEAGAAVYAWEAAARHWQAALALLPSGETAARVELLLLLGAVQTRAEDRAGARERFRQAAALARALGSGELLARAALGYAGVWVAYGRSDAGVIALLGEALDHLGESASVLRPRLLARLSMELSFTDGAARRDTLSAEAVAVARRLSDTESLVQALHARHYALGDPEQLEERLAIADEFVAVAAAAGAKDALALGHGWRFGDRLEAGELDGADRDLAAFTTLATALQQPLLLWRAAMWRAMRALLDGRFAEAEGLIAEAAQLGERTQNPDLPLTVSAQRHVLHRQLRRLTEADLAEALAARRNQAWGAVQDPWLMRLAADLGRQEEAQAGLDRLAAHDFAAVPRGPGRLTGLALLAEVAARLEDRRHADALYGLLTPFAARPVISGGAVACHGAVAYYLARLATALERWPDAEAHFEAATALHERLGARPFLAQTWLDHGRMLLARGRPEDAEHAADLVARARGLAEALGMAPLAEAAAQLILPRRRRERGAADHGAPRAPSLPDGLTIREVEVLRLLAAGLTNKEIAAALVVSDRTVGNHIANLYGKIDARRRADATAYALRHGLADPQRPPAE